MVDTSPRRLALVIGANGPPGFQRLRPLQHAEGDADRMEKALGSLVCGYKVVRPGTDADAIMAEIEPLLGSLEYQDQLLFYFAGHGMQKRGRLHLLLNTSDDTRLRGTTLIYDLINEIIRDARPDHKIIILDCCHSGLAIDPNAGVRSRGDAIAEVIQQQTEGSAASVLAACGPDETARESDRLGGGILTTLIVEALSARDERVADRETGHISTESLRNWLYGRISELRKDPDLGEHLERPILRIVGNSPTYLTIRPVVSMAPRKTEAQTPFVKAYEYINAKIATPVDGDLSKLIEGALDALAVKELNIMDADELAVWIVVEAARMAPNCRSDQEISTSRLICSALIIGDILKERGEKGAGWFHRMAEVFRSTPQLQEFKRRRIECFHRDDRDAGKRLNLGFSKNAKILLNDATASSSERRLTSEGIAYSLLIKRDGLLNNWFNKFAINIDELRDAVRNQT